jgi:uncharacterized delta-60 repeat protein
MKTSIILLFILLSSLSSFAQVTQEWVAKYNGPPGNQQDKATDIAVDNQGNVYITGYSEGTTSDFDYATIKYNSAGVQQWVARYNGIGNNLDFANAVKVDASGNVYVTGQSMGFSSNRNYVTIKYNSSGVELWVAIYEGPAIGSDIAYDLAIDGDGNVYVTGSSAGITTMNDYTTIKYNSNGIQQWVARYNGPANANDGGNAIKVDGIGNVYVIGTSSGSGTFSDITTIKYNTGGDEQWVRRYDGPENSSDMGNALVLDAQGNVIVTGYSTQTGTQRDYTTIKYNSSGTEQWTRFYNGSASQNDIVHGITVDNQNNIYITGESIGTGSSFDYATIKYNPAGVEQWVTRYNGTENLADIAWDIEVDAQGNSYITGGSDGSGTSRDYTTIKYNTSGVEQWLQRYSGTGNGGDLALRLSLDDQNNVHITGQSIETGTADDYVTIKYSQATGIQNISSEIPDNFSLSQNYPNPFNPSTKIKFDIPKSSFVKLAVYDMLGKKVSSLVYNELKAGTYEYTFDAAEYNSGVYFYKLETDGFVETKKMLYIK